MLKYLPVRSALQRFRKLEKRFDQVCAELKDEQNKNFYLQAQEVRAEIKEIGPAPVSMNETRFTMSPVDDTYACAVAREKAFAAHFMTKFRNDNAAKEIIQGITRQESLPSKAEDQGRFHFIREVFGTRACTA